MARPFKEHAMFKTAKIDAHMADAGRSGRGRTGGGN